MSEKLVAIITGASSGIGQNIATELSGRGYAVVLCGRNKEGLEATSKRCRENKTAPEEILQISGDLSDPLEPERIVSATINKFGRINVLVNNAGFLKFPDTLETVTAEYFDAIFSVNIRAPVLLTKACMPYLEKSKGVIINISSTATQCPQLQELMLYRMTKSAMDIFTKSIAYDYAAKGVRVCGILPGVIASTQIMGRAQDSTSPNQVDFDVIMQAARQKPIRSGKMEDVSKLVAYLTSEEGSFMTGENIILDGGIVF